MNKIKTNNQMVKRIITLLLVIMNVLSVWSQDTYRVSSRILNMRSGEGTGYGKILTLSEGDEVNVLRRNRSGWWLVERKGVSGYVSYNYLQRYEGGKTGRQVVSGRVVKVVDGDSFTLLDGDEREVKIRLYGIDCPEEGQDYAEKAREKAAEFIAGKTVGVRIYDRDRYGREVGVVPVGEATTLNEILLIEGLAWNYTEYNKLYPEWYGRLEKSARMSKTGLWSVPNPTAPWDYRHNKGGSAGNVTVPAAVPEYLKRTEPATSPKTNAAAGNNIPVGGKAESSVKEEKVMICRSSSSYAYHTHYCRGLSRCKHQVETVAISKAKSMGYRACQICY
jgi:endonuclease YncB( thermonuclease family)